jgi:hypothetical protein
MREYVSGATRDSIENKPNYEGFLSPLVLEEFGRYMHQHRIQADGEVRDGDNWQKGIPTDDYMDSLIRHTMDVWLHHRGYPEKAREDLKEALCAVMFNVQGLLYNLLLERMQPQPSPEEATFEKTTLPCDACGGDEESGHQGLCPVSLDFYAPGTSEPLYDPDEPLTSKRFAHHYLTGGNDE